METQSQKMIKIVKQVIQLLKMSTGSDAKYYCDFFIYILEQLNKSHELSKIAENILKAYGGMATFNDVVLHRNGDYLTTEGDEFEELRTKLFLQCEEVIEEARG